MIDKVTAVFGHVKMWVWEQLVLGVLVAGAVWAQVAALPERVSDPRDVKTIALAVLTGFMVIAGQKVRSTADRQREANKMVGVENAPLECARAQEAYGVIFQCLSLAASVATAYTRWQWAVALYVVAYPLWRRFYRTRIKPLPVMDAVEHLLCSSEVLPLNGTRPFEPSRIYVRRTVKLAGAAAVYLRQHGQRLDAGLLRLRDGGIEPFLAQMSDDERASYKLAQAITGDQPVVNYSLDVQFDDPAIGGVHPHLKTVDADGEKTLVSPKRLG